MIGDWSVDTPDKVLMCSLLGIAIGVISLHVMNALAFVTGRFARFMLGGSESTSLATGDEVKAEG